MMMVVALMRVVVVMMSMLWVMQDRSFKEGGQSMKRLANLAKLCRTIMTKRERMASAAIVQTETVGNLPLELLIGFSNIRALTGILFRCQYICGWYVWKYSVTAQPMQWI